MRFLQDSHSHNAVLRPQQPASGSDAPTSPSRWRRADNSTRSSQEGSGHGRALLRSGSQAGLGDPNVVPWEDACSSGEVRGESTDAGDDFSGQHGRHAMAERSMNRAAHVGAVAGPLLEFVRWDLLPDAPSGAQYCATLIPQLARMPESRRRCLCVVPVTECREPKGEHQL